jgi:putative endonuclease
MTYEHKYYFVYLLKCSDNSIYTGITNDLDRRLVEHESGSDTNSYTYSRRPVVLVYSEYFTNPNQVIAFEKKVKGWSRAKKEALIKSDWDKIKFLSQCRNSTHSANINIEKNK